MEDYFTIKQVHCQGKCDFNIDSNGNLFTIGCDDLIYHHNLVTNEQQRIDVVTNEGSYTTIGVHPTQKETLVVGGLSKKVEILKNKSQSDSIIAYNCSGEIYSLQFSPSGKLLIIATQQQMAVIYNWQKKKFMKCRPGHNGSVLSVFFSNNQQYVCSTGTDGYLRIYKIEQKTFQIVLASTQPISNQITHNPQQILKGSFNFKDNIIAAPGKANLRQIDIINNTYKSTLNPNIKHQKQITLCYWQNDEVLITCGLQKITNIWNFHKGEKITSVPQLTFSKIVRYKQYFIGINESGNIFEFSKPQILKITKPTEQNQPAQQQQEEQNKALFEDEADENQSEEQQHNINIKKNQKSKADKIITSYPQHQINKSTEFFRNSRFLLYNQIGCIIQRIDSQNRSIEVQYHDASIIAKKKMLFRNREMKYFDLQLLKIAYANQNQFGFFGESSWEYKMNDIQGITLGTDWLAVINEEEIKIYDLGGNQISNIQFDRQFVAMSAYENLLVIVYHDSIPMWGCNSLRMKIFEINEFSNRFIIQSSVPLKPGSNLKAFGFSDEGMIYSQDTKGKIRVFLFQKNQWQLVYDPTQDQQNTSKYWIVGISNYQLLAFKLPEGQLQPTVFPRSILRKIKIQINTVNKQDLFKDPVSSASIGQIMWKNQILAHQRFRHKNWFKYKYSREEKNAYYGISFSILSQQQLKIKEKNLDSEFYGIVNYMISKNEGRRAFQAVRTFVKTKQVSDAIVELFWNSNLKDQAQLLQKYFEQKQKQHQYELAENLKMNLTIEMEKNVNIKPLDPMQKRRNKQDPNKADQKNGDKPKIPFYPPKPFEKLSSISQKPNSTHEKEQNIFNPFATVKSNNISGNASNGLKKPIEAKATDKPLNRKL